MSLHCSRCWHVHASRAGVERALHRLGEDGRAGAASWRLGQALGAARGHSSQHALDTALRLAATSTILLRIPFASCAQGDGNAALRQRRGLPDFRPAPCSRVHEVLVAGAWALLVSASSGLGGLVDLAG